MPWAAFDGLPAELRRSVSGRMFLETPLLGEAWRREAGDAGKPHGLGLTWRDEHSLHGACGPAELGHRLPPPAPSLWCSHRRKQGRSPAPQPTDQPAGRQPR